MTKTDPFAFAQAQHERPSQNWHGWCLVFVHDAFGVPARYPSAAAAWINAAHKHPETDPHKIPRGVPVFWAGGSHGYGHVAVSRGDGTCWTTDLIRDGQVDVAPIELVRERWGLTLVGWTEDLNGVTVWTPPKPAGPGPNVQAAIDATKQAQGWAKVHHRPGRVRQLGAALAALVKIR